jgi:hypothetical protein
MTAARAASYVVAMIARTTSRRLAALGSVLALTLSLAPAAEAHHARPPGPVNAANTYGWGKHVWQDRFVGPVGPDWRIRGKGVVRNQHGMLTLNTAKSGTVSATLLKPGHKVGRWEIRLRSRRYETGHTDYKVRTELIPAGDRKLHCGARNIALESYRPGHKLSWFSIHTMPDNEFVSHKGLNLGNDRWHTFAVEVTKKHISWFVDAHVIATERRAAALSGVPFTVRFTMSAKKGARMNQSRMQMDWLRYHTLRKPNQKSIKAPQPERRTNADAC